jgi:LacI family transcriptional regulator
VSTSKAHRIGSYLQKENIKGICVVGYDLVTKNIELLKDGYISFLINQNPKRQAQLSINTLRNFLLYKQPADQIKFFPIEIIIKSNLSDYSFQTTV